MVLLLASDVVLMALSNKLQPIELFSEFDSQEHAGLRRALELNGIESWVTSRLPCPTREDLKTIFAGDGGQFAIDKYIREYGCSSPNDEYWMFVEDKDVLPAIRANTYSGQIAKFKEKF